jgi:tetratricopeptide (TPR) repeat protein
MRWLFITTAASLSIASLLFAPNLRGEEKILGAAKAISQIQETLKKPPAAPEATAEAVSPVDLHSGIQQLENSLKTIKPEEHAARWLKLAEALSQLLSGEEGSENQGNSALQQLVTVIPPPETWPKLIEALRAKPIPAEGPQRRGAVLLHGLAAILANDSGALEKLRTDWLAKDKDQTDSSPRRVNEPFGSFAVPVPGISPRQYQSSRGELEPAEQVAEIEKMLSDDVTTVSYTPLFVPDLIAVLGEEKAKTLVDKILKSTEVQALTISSTPTRKLFKERALALGDALTRPLWELVEDADDVPLYEVFSKFPVTKALNVAPQPVDQFGEAGPVTNSGIPLAAENVFLVKLLDEDRNDDIKKIILRRAKESAGNDNRNNPYGNHRRGEAPKEYFNTERAGKLLRIYETTFADKPLEMPWAEYLELAGKQKTTEPVLKTVDRALADAKLNAARKAALASLYFDYLLVKELNTDAVKVLRAHLIDVPASARQQHSSDTPLSQSLKLHFLGTLLDNEEWAKEGLEKAEKIYAAKLKAGDYDTIAREFDSLFEALLQLKRYGDAEKLAIDTLTASIRQETSNNNNRHRHYSSSPTREALLALCVVYDELNRRDEIIKLFETAPWWQTADLGSIITQSFAGRNIGVIAARAMADAKQTDHALRILDVVIEKNPGLDAAYELLIGIDPAGSMKKLETAAKRDPYQERPLIWQARLLLEAGDIPRAGQTIREAITIDPSDGEQGKNTRMLAYKVLAEVLRKEGDEDAAKIFDGVIAAIRKSERADDYNRAGLHAIARKMYKDSLALFNDAYCIQSRLAIELFQNGDLEQAAIHYERAFQLMPGSFGMIESHCFGCEGAFASELAQSLAEKIFLRLLQEDPKKPQVHYLLGYLRSTQGRNSEALKHYKEAVRLAPRYLNAWVKLASIAEKKPEHAALYDEAQLALLRIDPQQKHSRLDTDEMHDLRKLWTALQTAAKEKVAPATFSFELAAVKAEQQRASNEAANANGENNRARVSYIPEHYQPSLRAEEPTAPYPGQALSRNRRIQELQQLLSENR